MGKSGGLAGRPGKDMSSAVVIRFQGGTLPTDRFFPGLVTRPPRLRPATEAFRSNGLRERGLMSRPRAILNRAQIYTS